MSNNHDEKIEKLPRWAKEYIYDLRRQRDESVATLNRFKDDQTVSDIWTEEWTATGEPGVTSKRHYIQDDALYIGRSDANMSRYKFYIRFRDGVLHVATGWRGLFIHPGAANTITISENKE